MLLSSEVKFVRSICTGFVRVDGFGPSFCVKKFPTMGFTVAQILAHPLDETQNFFDSLVE
jgi:hypothetical protein